MVVFHGSVSLNEFYLISGHLKNMFPCVRCNVANKTIICGWAWRWLYTICIWFWRWNRGEHCIDECRTFFRLNDIELVNEGVNGNEFHLINMDIIEVITKLVFDSQAGIGSNTYPFVVVTLIDVLNVVLSKTFWMFQKLAEALTVCCNFVPTVIRTESGWWISRSMA